LPRNEANGVTSNNSNYSRTVTNLDTVVSKSVANPWRDPKIAVLAGQKAVKKWVRQLRGK
jgi:hypothetical protein